MRDLGPNWLLADCGYVELWASPPTRPTRTRSDSSVRWHLPRVRRAAPATGPRRATSRPRPRRLPIRIQALCECREPATFQSRIRTSGTLCTRSRPGPPSSTSDAYCRQTRRTALTLIRVSTPAPGRSKGGAVVAVVPLEVVAHIRSRLAAVWTRLMRTRTGATVMSVEPACSACHAQILGRNQGWQAKSWHRNRNR